MKNNSTSKMIVESHLPVSILCTSDTPVYGPKYIFIDVSSNGTCVSDAVCCRVPNLGFSAFQQSFSSIMAPYHHVLWMWILIK